MPSFKIVIRPVILLLAGSACLAAAATAGPLLSKSHQSGFTFPHSSVQCELYSDRIVITRDVDGISTVAETPITLTGDIGSMIAQAKCGKTEGQCNIADIATTTYLIPAEHSEATVLLKLDCGNMPDQGETNNSPAARELVTVLDLNCPSP